MVKKKVHPPSTFGVQRVKKRKLPKPMAVTPANDSEIYYVPDELLQEYLHNLNVGKSKLTVIPYRAVNLLLENGARPKFPNFKLPPISQILGHRFLIPVFADYGRMHEKTWPDQIQDHCFLIEIVRGMSSWIYKRYDALGVNPNLPKGYEHKKKNLKNGYTLLRKKLMIRFDKKYGKSVKWEKEREIPLRAEESGCAIAMASAFCCRVFGRRVLVNDGTSWFASATAEILNSRAMRKAILDASGWTYQDLERFFKDPEFEKTIYPHPSKPYLPNFNGPKGTKY